MRTVLVDGSIISTVYLGIPHLGPDIPLTALMAGDDSAVFEDGYLFETAIKPDGEDWAILRRHKTEAEARVWHMNYLDKVVYDSLPGGSRK